MYRLGALYVVEKDAGEDGVERRLKQIDSRLFVNRVLTLDKEFCWVVYVDVDPEPIPLVEWRDDDGKPIPYLTDRLVERVARMDRDPERLARRISEKNQKLRDQKQKESDEEMAEIFREMIPMVNNRGRILAPRGQKLYQQRNRRRARGEL